MNYSDKIKALQHKAGIEPTGIASSKTWLNIYYLLFNTVPYDLNVDSLIKAIQEKINVRADGYPWVKVWDMLYELLIGNEVTEPLTKTTTMDPHNEIILQNMTRELAPFAKELIRLASAKGIHIRLINFEDNDVPAQNCLCDSNFGLAFEIWIFEQTATGEFIYNDNSPLYAQVAELGESIGLTWAGNRKTFTRNLPYFELRPAWAVAMDENEMVEELCRRKKENLNLLAIL